MAPEAKRRTRAEWSGHGSPAAPAHGKPSAHSKRPRKGAAVDEYVLTRDEPCVGAGEKGAERAELVRIAESPDRDSRFRVGPPNVPPDIPLRRRARKASFLPVGFKRSRLDRVDGHVVAREQPRRGRKERGQPGARARRDVETGDRRPDRTRGDVDDSAKLALGHARRERLHQRDRCEHVGLDALEDILAVDLAETLIWRPTVVVDQNVGVRADGDQFRTRRGMVEIAMDLANLDFRRLPQFVCRPIKGLFVPSVEHDQASSFRQRLGARATQAFARRANDRFPSCDSQFHCGTPALDTLSVDNYNRFVCVASSKRHENLSSHFSLFAPSRGGLPCPGHFRLINTGRCSCRICTWARAAARPIFFWICFAMSRPTPSTLSATSLTAGDSAPAGTGPRRTTTSFRNCCVKSGAAREWCSFPATTMNLPASSSA